MKRWALLVAAIYFVLLVLAGAPLAWVAFGETDALEIYSLWFFWLFAALMALSQLALLVVPVAVAEGRPVSRRKLLVPIVTTAFFAAVLFFAVFAMVVFGVLGDKAEERDGFWKALAWTGAMWGLWGWLFHTFVSSGPAEFVVRRLMGYLLGGSVLELLVAIPAHVMARRRDDCCAPAVTFLGIATGFSIALLSFGPGLFLLLAARIRKKRGKVSSVA
jgi:hypothetical protein